MNTRKKTLQQRVAVRCVPGPGPGARRRCCRAETRGLAGRHAGPARRRWGIGRGASLATAFLSLALAGCDNVQWSGMQVKVHEPESERPPSAEAVTDTVAAPVPLELPTEPLLFHVRRLDRSGRATIEPVAEVAATGLKPVGPQRAERADEFIAEFNRRYFSADQPYTLFRGPTRVGTVYVRSPAVSGSGVCVVLRAQGQIELRPRADSLTEFYAWSPGVRSGLDTLQVSEKREEMVTLSQVLARRAVTEDRIAGGWRFREPSDFRALQVGAGSRGFAATFMVNDSLRVGSPADSAGALLIVADYAPAVGYFPLFLQASWYAPGQKRALRWLDAVDLVGGPEPEWLLRAYGDAGSWYELAGPQGEGGAILWSSRRPVCEAREPEGRAAPG